jgi:hypothetical protein
VPPAERSFLSEVVLIRVFTSGGELRDMECRLAAASFGGDRIFHTPGHREGSLSLLAGTFRAGLPESARGTTVTSRVVDLPRTSSGWSGSFDRGSGDEASPLDSTTFLARAVILARRPSLRPHGPRGDTRCRRLRTALFGGEHALRHFTTLHGNASPVCPGALSEEFRERRPARDMSCPSPGCNDCEAQDRGVSAL